MTDGFAKDRCIALDEVGSTNLECLARARAGDPGGLWITADRQIEGRARRGRAWFSGPGNLHASLLLVDPAPPAALASLPLAAAVGVHGAIAGALAPGGPQVSIKWPNDILLGGGKVAGILLESETLANGRVAVVVGCGVNIAHAPGDTPYPAIALRAAASGVCAQELFVRLRRTMAGALRLWNGGGGIAAIRRAWLDRAEGLGAAMTVQLPDGPVTGAFRGIDRSGRLVLAGDDMQLRTIAAGDVFFSG